MGSTLLERREVLEEHRARAGALLCALETATTPDGLSLTDIDPQGVLLAAAKSLSRLAYTVGEFDLTIQLGPEDIWGLRMSGHHGQLSIEIVRCVTACPEHDDTPHTPASELAHLLWGH